MTARRRGLAWLLAGGVTAVGAVGAWAVLAGGPLGPWPAWTRRGPTEGTLEILGTYGEVPDFTLTERSGRAVTRADLLGRVWLATFVYTQYGDVPAPERAGRAAADRVRRRAGLPVRVHHRRPGT